jgi:hypothetical protein
MKTPTKAHMVSAACAGLMLAGCVTGTPNQAGGAIVGGGGLLEAFSDQWSVEELVG